MVIKINHVGDTEQQSQPGTLMTNIADGVSSISSFVGLIEKQASTKYTSQKNEVLD